MDEQLWRREGGRERKSERNVCKRGVTNAVVAQSAFLLPLWEQRIHPSFIDCVFTLFVLRLILQFHASQASFNACLQRSEFSPAFPIHPWRTFVDEANTYQS
jgi:hypothetical protein